MAGPDATHYDVLGVPPGASHTEIRRAYHRQARLYHPDVQGATARPGPDGGPHTMAAVNAAWDVLGDPVRRRAYDDGLVAAPTGGEPDPETDRDLDLADWWTTDEPDAGPTRPHLLIPAGLLVLAVVTWGFGVLIYSPVIWAASVVVLAASGFAFAAAPMLAMRQRARARRQA